MPLVNVKVLEGVFTSAQKQEMVRKLTDTMVSIKGENLRAATVVIIEEVKSGDWGFGGKPLTTREAIGRRGSTRRRQPRLSRSHRIPRRHRT
jgi:4-oxalocrotonate tautomerase